MYGKGQRESPVEPTHSRLVATHTGVLGALVIHSFFPELHGNPLIFSRVAHGSRQLSGLS